MPKLDMTRARSFSPAVEDYLKAIYRLQSEVGGPVSTNALGGWLGVTAPSASGMLKKLDDLRLVVYVPDRGGGLREAWRWGGVGEEVGRAAARRLRSVPGCAAERGRPAGGAGGGAPASPPRGVPGRDSGAVLGQGPRRGGGAGSCPLTRAVRGDSRQAG